jgi:hypothetical protein
MRVGCLVRILNTSAQAVTNDLFGGDAWEAPRLVLKCPLLVA